MRNCLTLSSMATLMNSLVLSRVDYCISCHSGLPSCRLMRLQRILNTAARVVYRSRRYCHVSPLLKELGWLPIQGRIEKRICILTFNSLQGSAPMYLSSTIKLASQNPNRRRLRSANTRTLVTPSTRGPTIGGRAFPVIASKMWNNLPPEIRLIDSLGS